MRGEEKGQESYFPSLLGHILGLACLSRSQLFPRSQELLPLSLRPRGGNRFTKLLAPGCFTTPSFPNLCSRLLHETPFKQTSPERAMLLT